MLYVTTPLITPTHPHVINKLQKIRNQNISAESAIRISE